LTVPNGWGYGAERFEEKRYGTIASHGSDVSIQPLQAACVALWLLLSLPVLALLLHRSQRLLVAVSFPISALAAFIAAVAGAASVAGGSVSRATLVLGLPDLPFTLRLDPLAGFFLVVVGALTLFVSIYSVVVRGSRPPRSPSSSSTTSFSPGCSWSCWPTTRSSFWWPGS
jgi:hypothetical protein